MPSQIQRNWRKMTVASILVASFSVFIGAQVATPTSVSATSTIAPLQPSQGEYFPIVPTEIFDTSSGIGGAPVSVANGSTFVIPVDGVGSVSNSGVSLIPSNGVSSVFVNIQVLSASASGNISLYEADIWNPGNSSVSFKGGVATSGSDLVAVAQSGTYAGEIAVTNNGSGSITLAIQVEGYFGDGSQSVAGDQYAGVPWTELIDSRNGYGGVTSVPLASGQSVSFSPVQLGVNDGVIASWDSNTIDAVNIEIGVLSPSAAGSLSLIGGNSQCSNGNYVASPLRQMSYIANTKSRLTDIIGVENGVCNTSNSNGQITITNLGSVSVQFMVVLRGYMVTPQNSDVVSATYTPLSGGPAKVCDTRIASTCVDQNGNYLPVARIGSNQSITVKVTGVAGVPTSGVAYVAEEIDALNASATGWLEEWAGIQPPSYLAPVVNFSPTDGGDNTFDNTIVTSTSNGGLITIFNASAGTVDVVLSARGFWQGPTAPSQVTEAISSYLNGYATVAWQAPSKDGGSPIQDYLVTTSGNSVTVVGGTSLEVMVPANQTSTVTVTAQNMIGSSLASANLNVDDGSTDPAGIGQSEPIPLNADVNAASQDQLEQWGLPPKPTDDAAALTIWQQEAAAAQGSTIVSTVNAGGADDTLIEIPNNGSSNSSLYPNCASVISYTSVPTAGTTCQTLNYSGYQMLPQGSQNSPETFNEVHANWIQPDAPICTNEYAPVSYNSSGTPTSSTNTAQQCVAIGSNHPSDWGNSARTAIWVGIQDPVTLVQVGCITFTLFKSASQYRCFFEDVSAPSIYDQKQVDNPVYPYNLTQDPIFHGLVARPGDRVGASMWIDQTPPHGVTQAPYCWTDGGQAVHAAYWAHYLMVNTTKSTSASMNQALCWHPVFNSGTTADFIVENNVSNSNPSLNLNLPKFSTLTLQNCTAQYINQDFTNIGTPGRISHTIDLSTNNSIREQLAPSMPEQLNNDSTFSPITEYLPSTISNSGQANNAFSVPWSNQLNVTNWDPFTNSLTHDFN